MPKILALMMLLKTNPSRILPLFSILFNSPIVYMANPDGLVINCPTPSQACHYFSLRMLGRLPWQKREIHPGPGELRWPPGVFFRHLTNFSAIAKRGQLGQLVSEAV
jgi:hypothetical protein